MLQKRIIATLTRDDVIVLWGAANDIGKNESSKDLSQISSFVRNRRHTSIVIKNAPHEAVP
jgi:3-methyladenine DNA glycosylase AlkC